jgi:hypothetical protein
MPSALGGAANEAGAEFRARVGALLASAVITETPLSDLGLTELEVRPLAISAETDAPVDDLNLTCAGPARVLVQAKLRVQMQGDDSSPLGSAMAQFAAAIRAGLRPDDRLVLATQGASGPVRAAARALARARYHERGAPTAAEAEALARLRAIAAGHLAADGVDALLRHLVVVELAPGVLDVALIARLEAGICLPGVGREAADALSDVVRELARLRAGHDARGLVRALMARHVPLHPAYDPRSALAREQAVQGHLERQRRRARTLALFALGADLAPVNLADADCKLRVADESHDDDHRDEELADVLRYRGRLLLVGEPGGGKSTALRALAGHAASLANWPTPILVDARRLHPDVSPTARILEIACEDALPDESGALYAGLAEELERERCLLLLDGLDEVRTGRAALLARLHDWLSELPAGNEVVLSSRPVAAAQASGLRLPVAQLRPPENPEKTAAAILRAVAEGAAGADADGWAEERMRWVHAAFERDPALAATPLTVVIVAAQAARASDTQALPRTRTATLLAAYADAPRRWEITRRHDELSVARLGGEEAEEAVAVSLPLLCEHALAGARAEIALDRIAAQLREAFALPESSAAVAARTILNFWTDAGVFAVEDDVLATRIRPLAEVGVAATWAHANGTQQATLVEQARAGSDSDAVLTLAAGLSSSIATLWAQGLAVDGAADELIRFVDAMSDGAVVESQTLNALIDARLDGWLAREEDVERVGEALLLLDLDDSARVRLRERLLARAAPERLTMMRALLSCAFGEDDEAAVAALRAFVEAPWPAPPRREHEDRSVYRIETDHVDSVHRLVYEQASVRLAELSPADLDLVADTFHPGSLEQNLALRLLCARAGRDDLVDKLSKPWRLSLSSPFGADWETEAEQFRVGTIRLLRHLATLAPPAVLAQRQTRALPELGELFAITAANYLRPQSFVRYQDRLNALFAALSVLAGFDAGTIAAQARLLADEIEVGAESKFFVYGRDEEREARGWDAVADVEDTLRALVRAIGVAPEQADGTLQGAIVFSPDPSRAINLLCADLSHLRGSAREFAARLILICQTELSEPQGHELSEQWLAGEDVPLARAGAFWASASPDRASTLWEKALTYPDENVRLRALALLDARSLTSSVRERLIALQAAPRSPFRCLRCGRGNLAATACVQCHQQAPQTEQRLRQLLHPEDEARTPTDPGELARRLGPRLRRARQRPISASES